MQNCINKKYKEYFDYIIMTEVMEYIFDPIQALKNVNQLLKIGGMFLVSFPFNYPVHNPYKNDMLRYTKHGAIKLLEMAGFKILECVPRKMKPISCDFYHEWVKSEGLHWSKEFQEHYVLGYIFKCQKI